MALFSLLYVSRSLVRGPEGEAAVEDIVRASLERNRQLGVTGALAFTGLHFSQVLEGTRDAVEALMASIDRDPRHTEVRIIQQGALEARRFETWALAYSGPFAFIDRTMKEAMDEALVPGRQRGFRLQELLEALCARLPVH